MAITVNGTAGSKDDIAINSVVQLDWNAAGTTFAWSIPDQPPGTAETLSNAAIKNPTIQVKKEHTRRVKIVVDGTTTDEVTISVRHLKSRTWRPAFGETTQEGARGWAVPLESTLDYAVEGMTRGAVVVGVTGAAGLVKGNVLRVTGETVIKSGLPGQDTVFTLDKALATSAANLDEALYVLEAGVDGSTTPASGALVVARFLGLHGPVSGVSSVLGEPVFVSDTGTLVRGAPGSNRRVVGSVARAGASDFDVAFCGAVLEWQSTSVDFRAVPSGTAAAPGLAFASDTGVNSGWFLQGQDSIGLATAGVERQRVNAAGQLLQIDGAVSLPATSFLTDPDTGPYHESTNSYGIAAGGVGVARFTAAGIQAMLAGTAAAPSIAVTPYNMGLFGASGVQLGVAANGAEIARFAATGLLVTPGGTFNNPSIAQTGNTNTGLYWPSAGVLSAVGGGVESCRFTSQGISMVNGSVSLPALFFGGDPNTGIAWQSLDAWSMIAGGAETARVSTAGILVLPAGSAAAPSLRFDAIASVGLFLTGSSIGIAAAGAEAGRFTAQGLAMPDGSVAAPAVHFLNDTNNGFSLTGTDQITWTAAGGDAVTLSGALHQFTVGHPIATAPRFQIDNNIPAGQTAMLLSHSGLGLQRVTVGIPDSGGTNFRVLRVPN